MRPPDIRPGASREHPDGGLRGRNRSFYESIWRRTKLRRPQWFGTWASIENIAAGRSSLLEVGPGVRPRLPLDRAFFLDLSPTAARKLRDFGARAVVGDLSHLPFPGRTFDLVCAMDVVEHVPDPEEALRGLVETLKPGGLLIVALPLHRTRWTEYDELVGHSLRYDPDEAFDLVRRSGLEVLRSAASGILPGNRCFLRIAAWVIPRFLTASVFLEDRLVLPLARVFERPLEWRPGFHPPAGAAGIILVCRLADV